MSEWIVVSIIVGIVIVLTVRALYREASGKGSGCGSCPAAQKCGKSADGCATDDTLPKEGRRS